MLCLLHYVSALYNPGPALNSFFKNSTIEIFVNKLNSTKTQSPFDYYYLNFCRPKNRVFSHENVGIQRSPYNINMMENSNCEELCVTSNTIDNIKDFRWLIDNDYRVSLVMDNLPAGLRITKGGEAGMRLSYYEDGFPIGYKEREESGEIYNIYNHAHIVVQVNKIHTHDTKVVNDPEDTWRIVGFLVNPMSLKNSCNDKSFTEFIERSKGFEESQKKPEATDHVPIQAIKSIAAMPLKEQINFTYSVTFEETDIEWTSRWDNYLHNGGKKSETETGYTIYLSKNDEVYWLSIIKYIAIVLFLIGIVSCILGCTPKKDISLTKKQSQPKLVNESELKQVCGDVLGPSVGSGIISVIGSAITLMKVVTPRPLSVIAGVMKSKAIMVMAGSLTVG